MRTPVPYPAIEHHGVIGDRRTAALVAADGTMDWLCLPAYDGDCFLGSLLDVEKGGFWKLGPLTPELGQQCYPHDGGLLQTVWNLPDARLELSDVMELTGEHPEEDTVRHTLVRRLRCTRGRLRCVLAISVRPGFAMTGVRPLAADSMVFESSELALHLWFSRPLVLEEGLVWAEFDLPEGEEVWSVLDTSKPSNALERGEEAGRRARQALEQTCQYWQRWLEQLKYEGDRRSAVRRSAALIHLLTYAPQGSLVAAPTTSLPERLGGGWNADYRYTWIRDASLALHILALLGNTEDARRYSEWLITLPGDSKVPVQPLYGIRGETDLTQQERTDLYGYRNSRPVRLGNHAFMQNQHDDLGYLLVCHQAYLEQGGPAEESLWKLTQQAANYISQNCHAPGNGIWELASEQHYVSSKVMSWVGLRGACAIAKFLGKTRGVQKWQKEMDKIHAAVLEHGWSERLGAFRQRYEGENLDASALLIPVEGFLPPDHPRVAATVERIEEQLTINGLVYRFDPRDTPGTDPDVPLGEYEGSFWPCTFWLATTHALAGRLDRAESILARAEEAAGSLGLFAEGMDARTGMFLGNHPLLFSQLEYVRAILKLNEVRQRAGHAS